MSSNNQMSDDDGQSVEDRIRDYATRSSAAQSKAAQAIARLMHLAETRDSGQVPRIAQFLASTYNGTAFPWDPFDLRRLDVEISDDMLTCLEALRWGKADLYKLVPDGEKRVEAIIALWGLKWPASD